METASKPSPVLEEEPCLICLTPGSSPDALRVIYLMAGNALAEEQCLNSHLCAVFVLRKILNLSKNTCSRLLKITSFDPGDWFCLCGACSSLIQEAVTLHLETQRLTRKYEGIQGQLRDKLKESLDDENLTNGDRPLDEWMYQMIRNCFQDSVNANENGILVKDTESSCSHPPACGSANCSPNDDGYEDASAYPIFDIRQKTAARSMISSDDRSRKRNGDDNGSAEDYSSTFILQPSTSIRLNDFASESSMNSGSVDKNILMSADDDYHPIRSEADQESEVSVLKLSRRRSSKRMILSGSSCNISVGDEWNGSGCPAQSTDLNGRAKGFLKLSYPKEGDVKGSPMRQYAHPLGPRIRAAVCGICQMRFYNLPAMFRHRKEFHSTTDGEDDAKAIKYYCEYSDNCKYFGNSIVKMHSHMKKEHSNVMKPEYFTGAYTCNHCDFVSLSEDDVEEHRTNAHWVDGDGVKPKLLFRECNICDLKILGEEDALQKHVEHIHERQARWFSCETCHHAFRLKSRLDGHLAKAEGHQPRVSQCLECGEGYLNMMDFAVHCRSHKRTKEAASNP